MIETRSLHGQQDTVFQSQSAAPVNPIEAQLAGVFTIAFTAPRHSSLREVKGPVRRRECEGGPCGESSFLRLGPTEVTMRGTVMPPKLKEVYDDLFVEVASIHSRWRTYLQLFEDKNDVDLLNQFAPSFFGMVQQMMHDYIILECRRLTDNAESNGQSNLTFQRLAECIDNKTDGSLCTAVASYLDSLRAKVSHLREHASKRIAHLDFETRLNRSSKPLQPVTRQNIEEVLATMRKTMQSIEDHYSGADVEFSEPIAQGDAEALLYWLREAHVHRAYIDKHRNNDRMK
jgi:hypothetical protein